MQIGSTVFPMYKAYIEPDLKAAHLQIHNKFNPFSGFMNPTYILKSPKRIPAEEIKKVLKVTNNRLTETCGCLLLMLGVPHAQWGFYLSCTCGPALARSRPIMRCIQKPASSESLGGCYKWDRAEPRAIPLMVSLFALYQLCCPSHHFLMMPFCGLAAALPVESAGRTDLHHQKPPCYLRKLGNDAIPISDFDTESDTRPKFGNCSATGHQTFRYQDEELAPCI